MFVDENPVAFDCSHCDGTGIDPVRIGHDPTWCEACGGSGEDWLDRSQLLTLAHNLATAAGLCMAYVLGSDAQWNWDQLSEDVQWAPGSNRPAPGWEGK